MTLEIQVNCKPCMGDHCNQCLSDNCRCKNNNHWIKEPSLKDGVRVDFAKPIDPYFFKEYNEVNGLSIDGKDKIDRVCQELQTYYNFVTLRKTEEILLYNGKIYDKIQAKSIIKEDKEKRKLDYDHNQRTIKGLRCHSLCNHQNIPRTARDDG